MKISTDTTEYNDDRDVPSLPCPVCIEAASEKVGEKELVPEQALQRYTFAQLEAHLESDKHDQWEFATVALRASIYLYRHAFVDAFETIDGV